MKRNRLEEKSPLDGLHSWLPEGSRMLVAEDTVVGSFAGC